MATAQVVLQANTEVLEEGDEALLPKTKIDEGEELIDIISAPTDETSAPEAKPAPAAKPAAPAAPEDADIPAELRGKSPAELARMYREAQSLIGRQGSELGELRRRADQAIQTSLAALARTREPAPATETPAAPAEVKIDEAEFFRAPQEAIAKAIEASPVIKQIRETLGKAAETQAVERAMAATQRFNSAHPDAAEIMADPEFRTWVTASRVRTELLRRAHQRYDFDAGDEVFGTWKALKGTGKPKPGAAEALAADAATEAAAAAASAAGAALAKRKRDLAAATVPSGGTAAGAGPDKGAKKVFRRADILKLMEENPERYEALSGEIEKAYREGRVR
jgi:hypothetical protein